MKRNLILLFLVVLNAELFAQNQTPRTLSKCRYIYVWDFLDQEKNQNRDTKDITEAVEEALINIDECFVLQRRNLATLVNHAAAEKGVNSVKDMKYEITHALSGSGAKQVLFGVVDMSARDAYEVKLRIEDLNTSRIISAKSTRILRSEIANIDQRNKVIYKLVCGLVGILYIESPSRTEREFPPRTARTSFPTDQPKSNSNAKKNFTMSAKSGLELVVGECIGNSYNQTVTINFTFVNNDNPNLSFEIPIGHPFASDEDGNQYAVTAYSLGGEVHNGNYIWGGLVKEFYTGTKLRASVTFGGILPRVKKLSVAKIPFIRTLLTTSNSTQGELTFRDFEINWR